MSTTYNPNPTTDTSTFWKGTTRKSFAAAAISVGALATAALALAGAANAAPAGPATVDQTVSQLQANSYQVILSKFGTAQLNQCTVSAVRPGQTYSRTDSGAPGAGNDLVTTVMRKTVNWRRHITNEAQGGGPTIRQPNS